MTSSSYSSSSSAWKYTISELYDAFCDITTTTDTPINAVVTEDDYFHQVECDHSNNNNHSKDNNDTTGNEENHTSTSQPQRPIFAVATIDYTEAFRIAYGFFRIVVLQQHEVSSVRTLLLTGTCLQLNPANYTVWHSRRQCLSKLYQYQSCGDGIDSNNHHHHDAAAATAAAADDDDDDKATKDSRNEMYISMIRNELYIAAILGGNNPKNYQIWYHRRAMLEHLPPTLFLQCIIQHNISSSTNDDDDMASTMRNLELDYIHTVLLVDEKNYHAWSHRQWIVSKMIDSARTTTTTTSSTVSTASPTTTLVTSIYDHELMYCENFINRDIRNNSAWNHRWFIVHARTDNRGTTNGETAILPVTTMEQELDYTMDIMTIDPYNESPCKYLVALVRELCDIYNTDDSDIDRHNGDITNNNNTETDIPISIVKQHSSMIQTVREQLHNIEQNHLLSSRRPDHVTTEGGMETTTGSEGTTIPSIHLYRAMSEIDSSRPIWMVDDHSKK